MGINKNVFLFDPWSRKHFRLSACLYFCREREVYGWKWKYVDFFVALQECKGVVLFACRECSFIFDLR